MYDISKNIGNGGKMKNIKIAAILSVLTLCTSNAFAVSIIFNPSIILSPSCTLKTENIAFGQYNAGAGDKFSTGKLTVRCTRTTTGIIGVNRGNGIESNARYSASQGGQSYIRYMAQGDNKLLYNLFKDSSHTQVLGGENWFTARADSLFDILGSSYEEVVTVYAAMPGGQYVTPGTYSDTVVTYITY